MKRIILLAVLALIVLAAFVPVSNADMAKEGNGNYKSVVTYTFNAIPVEKERLYLTFDAVGAVPEAPADSPLFKATFHSLGALEAIKGAYKESGFVMYFRPNGDKVYATFKATGTIGGNDRKITLTFVGGTGECTGIEGGGEFTGVGKFYRKPTEKVRVSMSVGKFHWKIPQKKK